MQNNFGNALICLNLLNYLIRQIPDVYVYVDYALLFFQAFKVRT